MRRRTPGPRTYEPPGRYGFGGGPLVPPRGELLQPRSDRPAAPPPRAGSGHAQRLLAPGEGQERGRGEVDRRLGRAVGLDVVAVDGAAGTPRRPARGARSLPLKRANVSPPRGGQRFIVS